MSDLSIALVASLVVATLLFAIAIAIPVRGPAGLVKNVDWRRVSDPQGLGEFASLVMTLMSAMIAAHGVALYAFAADRAARNVAVVAFVVLIAILTLALALGQQRYPDQSPHDGRR
ncbi:MAG: hypothetical protein ABI846_08060 [Rudaea sp.]